LATKDQNLLAGPNLCLIISPSMLTSLKKLQRKFLELTIQNVIIYTKKGI